MPHETPLSDTELAELVCRAQQGDTEAFGRVYSHYFLQVYRYTAFRVGEETAEDLVADIFVKAWEKLHSYKQRKNIPFGAWLFRIARHVIIDAYRKGSGAYEEMPEDVEDPDVLNHADSSFRRSGILRSVRRAMERLPRRYREILAMSYVAELSHREIARALRMTEGGVRILKFRALRKLESFLPSKEEIDERA